MAAFWNRICLSSSYRGHSVKTCISSSTLSGQLKHNLWSCGIRSYRPVSILSGATPHLNFASAFLCCLFKTSSTYGSVQYSFLNRRYFLSLFLWVVYPLGWPTDWRIFTKNNIPGAVARSEARSLGMQAAPSSIPTSGTFFRGDLVMKTFLRLFSLFRWFKKSSCQLLAKECALSTGKLPRRLVQEQCG